MRRFIPLILVLTTLASAQTYVYIVPNLPPPASNGNTTVQVCVGVGWCSTDGAYVFSYENAVTNLQHYCKKVVITSEAAKADYALKTSYQSDFNGGLTVILLNREGSIVYSQKTRHIHNAFKDMCKDFLEKKEKH